MHWLFKFVIIVAGNALALWLAWLYVPGFELNTTNWVQLALIALDPCTFKWPSATTPYADSRANHRPHVASVSSS